MTIRTSERFLFFWVSFQFLVFAQDDNNGGSCPLTCLNDSVCKLGDANFADHPTDSQGEAVLDMHKETSLGGYHCECPEGFTGMTCSDVFESCADNSTKDVCYHGGACVRGELDAFDNWQYHCDCSNAIRNGTFYAGKYCEHPAVNVCDADKHTFCVNNGECVANVSVAEPPCDCDDDFTGAHCEYFKSDTPMCTQTCVNGGTCQIGIPNAPQTPRQDSYNMTYCLCPERYHGQQCEYDSQQCGDHLCFHGTTCNIGDLTCNCASSSKPGIGYAGEFCQYTATDFCSDGKKFCVNGGNCVEENGNSECICPHGWKGPACDIESDFAASHKCLLECQNEGKCQTGVIDGTLLGLGPELDQKKTNPNEDEEHCVCPKGYMGSHCETSVQECGDDVEHICLHGSTCQREGESGEWTCDCEKAFTPDRKYAGTFCQHHHTTTCTNDGISGIYEGPSNFAFCVNDGLCIEMIEYGETHAGCSCPDDYTGVHCELTKSFKSKMQQPPSAMDASSHVAILFVLLLLSILMVAVAAVMVYRMRERMQANKFIIENSHMEEEPFRGTMEQVGFVDESELEDVLL